MEIKHIDVRMVYGPFSITKESAGALDGWMPKELSLLSIKVCEHIATMLNQIEAGAAWPKSATHARMVYLEKLGAEFGKGDELQTTHHNSTTIQSMGHHET